MGIIEDRDEKGTCTTTISKEYYVPIKPLETPALHHNDHNADLGLRDDGSHTSVVEKHHCDMSLSVNSSSTTSYSTSSSTLSEWSSLLAVIPEGQYSDHDNEDHVRRRTSTCDMFDWIFFMVGFSRNPFAENTAGIRNDAASDMRLALLSNFSTAYNIVSISLALTIMEGIYPTTLQDKSLCSSALIAGMIIGQLAGGFIGDILGRHLAMAVVMGLQVVGAIATAFSFDLDDRLSIYTFLACWRFLLGLGCGGVYPLAATITAESASSSTNCSDNKVDASKSVALSFSMQGVGYLVAPLVGWTLLLSLDETSDLSWRLLLGFGAIPGLILMSLRLQRQMNKRTAFEQPSAGKHIQDSVVLASAREVPVSVLDAILLEEDLGRKLLGTAGCWFAFDVLFYGNVLFQPVVLSAAFGPTETLVMTAMHTVVVSSLALPGYFFSVIMVGQQSPRFIQAQGFLSMGILYFFIGILFQDLVYHKTVLVVLYGATFFFSNYGPNTTTYLLPSMTFSKSCRATLNGFCAASGKAGALLGAMFFVSAADWFGQQVVMLFCSCLSFIGLIVTLTCVSDALLERPSSEEEERQNEVERRLPMKVVLSEPSFIDYYDSA